MFGQSFFPATYFGPSYFGPAFFGTEPGAPVDLKAALVAALGPKLFSIVGTNIFPDVVPQSARGPALCYDFTAGERTYNLRGGAGMRYVNAGLDLLSPRESDVEEMAARIYDLLDGLQGNLAGFPVVWIAYVNEEDSDFEPMPGSDQQTHAKRVIYSIKLREPLPSNR